MLHLIRTKRTDLRLLSCMSGHYSQPKGFVGRNLCYAIEYHKNYYGHIVGGSATRFLPNRHETLGTTDSQLNQIVNNIFFHLIRIDGKYPVRNFGSLVLAAWRKKISTDWFEFYGDIVLGFESLVELPRTGDVYRRDGWTECGVTKGYTCKRVAGEGTDAWSGRRVWDIKNLRPKLVFVKKVEKNLLKGHGL